MVAASLTALRVTGKEHRSVTAYEGSERGYRTEKAPPKPITNEEDSLESAGGYFLSLLGGAVAALDD